MHQCLLPYALYYILKSSLENMLPMNLNEAHHYCQYSLRCCWTKGAMNIELERKTKVNLT